MVKNCRKNGLTKFSFLRRDDPDTVKRLDDKGKKPITEDMVSFIYFFKHFKYTPCLFLPFIFKISTKKGMYS